MKKLKAWELHTGGDKHVIAAKTAMQALKHYSSQDIDGMDSLSDDDEIIEIPRSEWKNRMVRNGEFDPKKPNDSKEFYSLEELIDGLVDPEIVSTTIQD